MIGKHCRPDQMLWSAIPDLGLHCLIWPVCPDTSESKYNILCIENCVFINIWATTYRNVPPYNSCYRFVGNLSPNLWGRGHIDFGAGPTGISRSRQ